MASVHHGSINQLPYLGHESR